MVVNLSTLRTKARDAEDGAAIGGARPREVNAPAPIQPAKSEPVSKAATPDTKGDAKAETASKSGSRRKPLFMGIGALALMGLAYFGYQYITVGRFLVSIALRLTRMR